jgi:hypothetical protein
MPTRVLPLLAALLVLALGASAAHAVTRDGDHLADRLLGTSGNDVLRGKG